MKERNKMNFLLEQVALRKVSEFKRGNAIQTVVDFRIWGPPTYWVRIQNNTALITGDARYPIRNVYGTKMDTKYWIPTTCSAVTGWRSKNIFSREQII